MAGKQDSCVVCGIPFVAWSGHQRTCSRDCGVAYQSRPKTKKMSNAQLIRRVILERDWYSCQYCFARLGPGTWSLDHIIPASLGGTDAPENLVSCCIDCNRRKRSGRLCAEVERKLIAYATATSRTIRWTPGMGRILRAAQKRYSDYPPRVYRPGQPQRKVTL